MKKLLLKSTGLFLILQCISLTTQAQLKVDAQYRNRFELRDGYQKVVSEGATPTAFISQRSRISLSYETEKLKLKFSPQDVRIWGDEQLSNSTGVYGDSASFDLFEGFIEIKLGNSNWLSIGRQQLVYDNERILAARNWNQNGIAYDAAVLKLNLTNLKMHVGSSWNTFKEASTGNFYPANRIKSLSFLWLNQKFNDNLSLSLLHVSSGVTETDTTNKMKFRQTTGAYADYTKKNFKAWGDVYYQYGKNKAGKNVNAFLIDADANYKIMNLTTGIGLGYLSGNSKSGADLLTDNLFNPLYGATHKYFGFMDYFRSFSSDTKDGGLADYYLYIDYKFSKSVSVRDVFHYFQLAKTNPATPDGNSLGYENDLVLKYKFSDWGTLENGYCFYLPTESLKTIQKATNGMFSQFFYVQLTITPTLFNQQAQ